MVIGLSVFVLVSLMIIAAESNENAFSESSKSRAQWKVQYSTDTDYFVYIADKYKQNTEICLLSKTANSAEGLDGNKNTYDENGNQVETLTTEQKDVDGKEYYGYCYITDNERYLKFGEQSTVLIFVVKAEHLDELRQFIEDVHDNVKSLDGDTATIPDNHTLRFTFESNLTTGNTMKIYANSSGTMLKLFPTYDENVFWNINLSEKRYYWNVKLNQAFQSTDLFDILINGQNATFDYIVDPMFCAGTLSSCTDIHVGEVTYDDCNAVASCDYNGCVGTITECSTISNTSLCSDAGCTVGFCNGSWYTCPDILDGQTCTNKGCDWDGYVCSGGTLTFECINEEQSGCVISPCSWDANGCKPADTSYSCQNVFPTYDCTTSNTACANQTTGGTCSLGSLTDSSCQQLNSFESACGGTSGCAWDSTSPAVSITSPANDIYTTANYVEINSSITETNFDSAWIRWDEYGSPVDYIQSCTGSYDCNVTITGIAEGTYTYAAYANDTGGQEGTSVQYTVHIDLTDPVIVIINPIEGNNYSTSPNLQVRPDETTSSDFGSIGSCWWSDDEGETNSTPEDCQDGLPYGVTYDFINQPNATEGSNTWTVYTNDSSGRQGSANVTFAYSSPCSYSGSGDWNIDCSENCNLSSSVNVTGNIFFSGIGNVSLSNKINLHGNVYIDEGCNVNLLRGSGFGRV